MKLKFLSMLMILSLVLTGCGSTKSATGAAPAAAEPATRAQMDSALQNVGGYSAESTAQNSVDFSSVRENAKIIIRANLELESQKFEEADNALQKLIAEMGGYLESASTYGAAGNRTNSYTARIPQAKFELFMSRVGDTCHVVSKSQTQEDITDAYVDNELRLKTLRAKQERLLVLLEKANTMENIVALENALTENEYQIEQLSATQRNYDRLTDYATIVVNLMEVRDLSAVPENESFLAEVKQAALSGAQGVMSLARGTILALVTVWPLLIAIGIVLAVMLRIGKKNKKEIKKEAKEQEKPE